MTNKPESLRRRRVVLPPTNLGSRQPPPQKPAEFWNNVTLDDIGAEFRPVVESALTMAERSRKAEKEARSTFNHDQQQRRQSTQTRLNLEMAQLRAGELNPHPFLIGNSPFFFFQTKLDITETVQRTKTKKTRALDKVFKTPLPEASKQKFVKRMGQSIERTVNFLWEDILPLTLSMNSSLLQVDDYVTQALDERIPLSVVRKQLENTSVTATHLRVLRFIGQQFNLSKEEQRLLSHEFYSRMRGGLNLVT